MSRSLFRAATLLDTGPLVAWFDRSDQDHEACAGFFQRHQGTFVSTWPVLTEVCHLNPADLADASLLWVAQEHGIRRVATLDRRDFGIVRLPGGEGLENLLNP